MTRGQIYDAATADLSYVDTEMYDVEEYGSIYVLDAERPALVDSGIGTHYEELLDAMATIGVDPEDLSVIALTHVHLDHAGGAGHLVQACHNAQVYVHEIGAQHLADPSRLWKGTKAAVGDQIRHYVEPEPIPEDRITAVSDGDTIDLGDHVFDVHHTPGHATHQVAFYDRATDGVFTGDAVGANTPATKTVRPLTAPPSFDLDDAIESVERLRSLEPSRINFAHFGDFPADDLLAEYETVLREWVAEVERALERLGDEDPVIEEFVAETDFVDVWGEEKGRGETRMNVRGVLQYLSDE